MKLAVLFVLNSHACIQQMSDGSSALEPNIVSTTAAGPLNAEHGLVTLPMKLAYYSGRFNCA